MSRYYYAGDEKVELKPSVDYVALKTSETRGAIAPAASADLDANEGVDSQRGTLHVEQLGIMLVPTSEQINSVDAADATARALADNEWVDASLPVFQVPNDEEGNVMVLTPRFRVQFKDEVTDADIEAYNQEHGVEIIEAHDLGHNAYLLAPEPGNDKDALDLANMYHRSRLTEYAEPDWTFTMDELASGTDTFFGEQWALPKMRVPQAWRITRGSSNVKIAIVDEGVQTSHPDLNDKIVTPYDAVGNDNNQEPNGWDGHGTACAGIAAAESNNAQGIAGVAQGCKILPVRIAYSQQAGGTWITNATWIARGIRQAALRGADVISNSWGGGPYSNTIRSALRYAQQNGRNGRGCVIISATGNANSAGVSYPAKYPESLACGASDKRDGRKNPSSPDGEHWWGSNYGPEVDFIAPGVQIYTTDLTGTNGYGSGDYVSNFNGTSSATPNAAGVAALVLSVDSSLRHWEVADIMRLSARDSGVAGKDDEHGYGRVDALRAVQAARRLWYDARLRLLFIGANRQAYLYFPRLRVYNSGLNRVRLNSLTLRSYGQSGNVIDSFNYQTDSGGIMQPGLSPTGGSGDHHLFSGILLKANGVFGNWSYRWRINFSYTYWRPSTSITTAGAAVDGMEVEEEDSFTLTIDSDDMDASSDDIEFEDMAVPEAAAGGQSMASQLNGNGARPVQVTFSLV